jgi:hypothetical protein
MTAQIHLLARRGRSRVEFKRPEGLWKIYSMLFDEAIVFMAPSGLTKVIFSVATTLKLNGATTAPYEDKGLNRAFCRRAGHCVGAGWASSRGLTASEGRNILGR